MGNCWLIIQQKGNYRMGRGDNPNFTGVDAISYRNFFIKIFYG